MDPELRKRFVDSIEYLRSMNFFQNFSSLSSEEILEEIFDGEIDYSVFWWDEEKFLEKVKEKRKGGRTHGQLLKKSLEEHEEYWMKASVYRVDLELAFFDRKRVFVEDWEIEADNGMGIGLMKKLARISRGLFEPLSMQEEWKRDIKIRGYEERVCCIVFFKSKGEEYRVDFTNYGEILVMNPVVKKINELINDTGYQYYCLDGEIDYIVYVVFSDDEVEKLRKRGWKLSLP
ncbi:MAG: hypothetical protein ACPL4E_04260 [Thermoproteota archaeon]